MDYRLLRITHVRPLGIMPKKIGDQIQQKENTKTTIEKIRSSNPVKSCNVHIKGEWQIAINQKQNSHEKKTHENTDEPGSL